MKTMLLLLCATLTAGAQSIFISGPYGSPPAAVFQVMWQQLPHHSAALEFSPDMVTWRQLGGYSVASDELVCHLNYVPDWAGSYFFRSAQTLVIPAAFAMWPADAFAP